MKTPEELLIALAEAHEKVTKAKEDFRKALKPVPYTKEAETIEEGNARVAAFKQFAAESYKRRCDANRFYGTIKRACVLAGRKLKKEKSDETYYD